MPTPQTELPSNRYFTKTVTVPKRDPDTQTEIKGPDGETLVDHTLGNFTFKRPSVLDLRDIGLRRAQAIAGTPGLDVQTQVLVEVCAVLPYQVHAAPPGWDWEEQFEPWDLVAIYQAYTEGVQEYGKPKPNGVDRDPHWEKSPATG